MMTWVGVGFCQAAWQQDLSAPKAHKANWNYAGCDGPIFQVNIPGTVCLFSEIPYRLEGRRI